MSQQLLGRGRRRGMAIVSCFFNGCCLKCFFLPPPPTSKLPGRANPLHWMVHVTYSGPLHELFLGPPCRNPPALALESLHLSIPLSLNQHTPSLLHREETCYFRPQGGSLSQSRDSSLSLYCHGTDVMRDTELMWISVGQNYYFL